MCGIAGVMGSKLGFSEIQKFSDIFTFAQVRGAEGAGIISIPNKDVITPTNIRCRRTTWSSGHLVTTQEFSEVIKGDINLLLGHARQPTKGGNSIDNVHPHRFEHIYMIHNGTMSWVNGESIPVGHSDSKMVCRAIAQHGIRKFVDNSHGAYCLVWLDLKAQTLNFLRNDQRPLWMCEEKFSAFVGSTTENVFWASEAWMLHVGLSRYSGYNKERHNFFQLPADKLYSYPLDVKNQIADPVITEMKKIYPVSTYGSSSAYGTWEEQLEADRDPVPFVSGVGDVGNSTKVTTLVASSNATTSGNEFRYTPPEYRDTNTRPAIQVASVLSRSRNDAMLNSASVDRISEGVKNILNSQKGGASQTALFPDTDRVADLEYYRCKDQYRIKMLVDAGPCVWCAMRPVIQKDFRTNIFPVRYTEDRREYVCETCIHDLDVQRMVGIAV